MDLPPLGAGDVPRAHQRHLLGDRLRSDLSERSDADDYALRSTTVRGISMDPAVARLAGALLALSGCVYEWNGDTPTFPLTGNPPALSSFDRLNQSVAGRPSLMTGPDGATWVAFC